jgi:hypothetical protein
MRLLFMKMRTPGEVIEAVLLTLRRVRNNKIDGGVTLRARDPFDFAQGRPPAMSSEGIRDDKTLSRVA